MKRILQLVLFTSVALLACEEQIDWRFEDRIQDLIVVESVITNEFRPQLVKLSRPVQAPNEAPEPISGANISIRSGADNYILTENPVGSGLYYSDPFIAVTGKIYVLNISYNGKFYQAAAAQPPVEPLTELSIFAVSDSTYAINFIETGTEPNYVQHFLNWQSTEGCNPVKGCEAKVIFYDLKNIDVNKQFNADQEVVTFPFGTTVVRKKFSVSDGYQSYLRGILSETYWRGGLFDVYPANAITNLSDGAVGYFAASSVVSDTTIIR